MQAEALCILGEVLIRENRRYDALVRFRENMESVALFRGEHQEMDRFQDRFAHVISNWWGIMQRTKLLNALTSGYDQVAIVFPFIVASPRYFTGQIPLGGLTQTASAFGHVQGSLSWFVTRYPDLAQWYAITERLAPFHRAIATLSSAMAFAPSADPVKNAGKPMVWCAMPQAARTPHARLADRCCGMSITALRTGCARPASARQRPCCRRTRAWSHRRSRA